MAYHQNFSKDQDFDIQGYMHTIKQHPKYMEGQLDENYFYTLPNGGYYLNSFF